MEAAIAEIAEKLLTQAATRLPDEVEEALRLAGSRETNQTARAQLDTIARNLDISRQKSLSICQDPGIPAFEVALGSAFPVDADFPSLLTGAVERITSQLPLRQNIVHPLSKKNPGTNTGWKVGDRPDCGRHGTDAR